MVSIDATTLRKKIGSATRERWISSQREKYLGLWDEHMLKPRTDELRDYVTFARSMINVAGVRGGGEGFDCEDFSLAFMSLARLRAAQRGARHSVAIGIAYGLFAWRPNEAHCCNWTLVDTGGGGDMLVWIEPQELLDAGQGMPRLRPFADREFDSLTVMIA